MSVEKFVNVNGGGGASYGSGAICALAVVGTFAGFAAGIAGGFAMLAVTGSACGFSLCHADKYDTK